MRPEILNPLFAETLVLKGVGPALAKPLDRLGLARVVDVAFHLPTGYVDRLPRTELMSSDAGRIITITLTPRDYKISAGRGPTRVQATDELGNYVSLVFFGGSSGWAKKLLPIGEAKRISGRLDEYGQELQIVHPDIVEPDEELREREPIYPLSEGLTSRRLAALTTQAVARAPDLPEWIEPGLKAKREWPGWHESLARIHADPSDAKARERLAYDEVFANQLAMTIVRADTRKRRGRALQGDGRLRDLLKLPYTLTGAQSRTVGEIDILIGTHAIFQDAVGYKDLALVVVDEQHRFGVAQRMTLQAKGVAPPHLLAMTATPIPRTLTLAQYGEMDVSRLDEMPPGRQPIETRVISEDRLDDVVNALGRHLADGGQAYWVCPLVEESEKSDLAAAEMRAETLRARFGDKVALVHGRMKPAEKDAVMAEFSAAHTSVLVATTVIEVGVDVPNATLIVIEHADRFGLAQLHQLRGRVGRGTGRSICLLMRGSSLSETSRARLALMRETNDGFRIAEEDLRPRGAGELLGTKQSGEMAFRLATPDMMADLLQCAHDDARLLIDRDGGLEGPRGQAARTALYLFDRDAGVALLRSG